MLYGNFTMGGYGGPTTGSTKTLTQYPACLDLFHTFNWGIFPSYVSREEIIYAKGYTVTF